LVRLLLSDTQIFKLHAVIWGSKGESLTSIHQHSMNSLFTIGVPPNQSLKLTEPAVSFSPRAKKFFKEIAMPAARIVYMELAARRRSLAPVR
jgi:hypothetical protein